MTGLEPAASGVTGRRSNQLSYIPQPREASFKTPSGECQATNPRPYRENFPASRESLKTPPYQVFNNIPQHCSQALLSESSA